jgi:hypothetical protein
VAVLDLAELVNRKVHDELAQMNGRLEQLVAEAVDRELDRLVRDLVQARLEQRAEKESSSWEPTKTCIGCCESKPLHAFQPGRNQCRRCRNRAQSEAKRRRRQAAEVPAVPFSGSGSAPTGWPAATTPTSSA